MFGNFGFNIDECLGENMFVKDLSDVDEDEENGLFKGNF